MGEDSDALVSLGIRHGSIVFLRYSGERLVKGPELSEFNQKPFGVHMTVEKMVAAQTRLERQDNPKCANVSFDGHAVNAFQSYIQSALAFSIKRGGILYGVVSEADEVIVHAIFEPPQQGSAECLVLERGSEDEKVADVVAEALGWRKVGWIYSQSTKEREYICSAEEICQMASIQEEMGETAVTAVVALFPPDPDDPETAPEVHVEAFQVSEQCVKLWSEGWFQPRRPVGNGPRSDEAATEKQVQGDLSVSGMMPLTNPKDRNDKHPAIVAGKDVSEVDADYFLVPVGIKDHDGPLSTSFPIENRLLPQSKAEAKSRMQRMASRSYNERLADFHLLIWLARQPGMGLYDIAAIAQAIGSGEPVPEGYRLIVDGLLGL